jgi:hypothetical protein
MPQKIWEITDALGMVSTPYDTGAKAPVYVEALWNRRKGAWTLAPTLDPYTVSAAFNQAGDLSYGRYHLQRGVALNEISGPPIVINSAVSFVGGTDVTKYVLLPGAVGEYGLANSVNLGGGIQSGPVVIMRSAARSINGNYVKPADIPHSSYTTFGGRQILVCVLTESGWWPVTVYRPSESAASLRIISSLAVGATIPDPRPKADMGYHVFTGNYGYPEIQYYRGFLTPSLPFGTSQTNTYTVDIDALPNYGYVPLHIIPSSRPVFYANRYFYVPSRSDYPFMIVPEAWTYSSDGFMARNTRSPQVVPLAVYWTDAAIDYPVTWSSERVNFVILPTLESKKIQQLLPTSNGLVVLTEAEAFILRGNFGTNVSATPFPFKVGCDSNKPQFAAVVRDTIFTIWQNRVWAIQGGTAEPIGREALPASVTLTGLAYSPKNNVLYVTYVGGAYGFDLETGSWFVASASAALNANAGPVMTLNNEPYIIAPGSSSMFSPRVADNWQARNVKLIFRVPFGERASARWVSFMADEAQDIDYRIRVRYDQGAWSSYFTATQRSGSQSGERFVNLPGGNGFEMTIELSLTTNLTSNTITVGEDAILELAIRAPIRVGYVPLGRSR